MATIKERLAIRNLGPIREMTLDVTPFFLLVGPSGSGKSLVLKVLAMVRHIYKKHFIRTTLKRVGVQKAPFRLRLKSYYAYADIAHLITSETQIIYRVEVGGMTAAYEIHLAKGQSLQFAAVPEGAPFPKVAFVSDMRNALTAWGVRGARARGTMLDEYFTETYALWDNALDELQGEKLSLDYLEGSLSVGRNANGSKRPLLTSRQEKRDIPLQQAASGFQSSVPILAILNYFLHHYAYGPSIRRNLVEQLVQEALEVPARVVAKLPKVYEVAQNTLLWLHIEEPELSLDPGTQVGLMRNVVKCLNGRASEAGPSETRLAMTSHSPFIVSAINLLLKEGAGPWLTWERVGGYLLQDGEATSLRDEETQILLAPNLDSVADQLSADFENALFAEE